MNIRYPLLFLTGALVGGISTYIFVGSPEIQTVQGEIKFLTKTEYKTAPEATSAPATVEVFDIPKYPELENEPVAEETEPGEVIADEAMPEDPDTMATQVEKFERSIASEEPTSVVTEEAPVVEESKVDEIESTPESEQGIE